MHKLLKAKTLHDPSISQYLEYFELNAGPWDRLNDEKVFLPVEKLELPPCPQHPPPGANFYPQDMSKEEFHAFETSNPEASGFYSIVTRNKDGKLTTIPYSEAYKDILVDASKNLTTAASLLPDTNPTLKTFLSSRSSALLSNSYQQSDKDWVSVNWRTSNIEVTYGPYEVYTDKLLNQKAAVEAFISIIDHVSTEKLVVYSSYLQELEDHLPIDERMRNGNVGEAPPIIVVDQVFSAGDVAGPKTAAYNLPNDEDVIKVRSIF
jgi:hypothetical protein